MSSENNITKSDWVFRPSTRIDNHGIYYKYEQDYCQKHGMTEHVRVGNSTLCRQCASKHDKKRTQNSVTVQKHGQPHLCPKHA